MSRFWHKLIGTACLAVCALIVGAQPGWRVLAHEEDWTLPLVIDTDMGIDDLVAVSFLLQSPEVDLRAVVITPGACGPDAAQAAMGRLLVRFNRGDIPVHAGVARRNLEAGPVAGGFAERVVGGMLQAQTGVAVRPFDPAAYQAGKEPCTVLVLGPFTSLARALETRPTLAKEVAAVVFPGPASARENWNAARDPESFEAVCRSELRRVVMDTAAPQATKPRQWLTPANPPLRATSLAEEMCRTLLARPEVSRHYLEKLPALGDELAALFAVAPAFFACEKVDSHELARPRHSAAQEFASRLRAGRQAKRAVVLRELNFPSAWLRDDVAARRDNIIAKNGQVEWVLQVQMNEIHEHLGIHSILGVKMGLRAAELLNAPRHGMRVVSYMHGPPPHRCLNDGIIVATGCTPGRGLFEIDSRGAPRSAARFTAGSHSVLLTLKAPYQESISRTIASLLEKHGLDDPVYWQEIRRAGLDVWENWHRLDLFDAQWEDGPPSGPAPGADEAPAGPRCGGD